MITHVSRGPNHLVPSPFLNAHGSAVTSRELTTTSTAIQRYRTDISNIVIYYRALITLPQKKTKIFVPRWGGLTVPFRYTDHVPHVESNKMLVSD
jgi:hypothetical protein